MWKYSEKYKHFLKHKIYNNIIIWYYYSSIQKYIMQEMRNQSINESLKNLIENNIYVIIFID